MASYIQPGPYIVVGYDGGRVQLIDDETNTTIFSTFEDRNQVENICSAMNEMSRRLAELETKMTRLEQAYILARHSPSSRGVQS